MKVSIFFIIGCIIGNYISIRTEYITKRPAISISSECNSCHHNYKWYECIPIISYAVHGGKHTYCGTRYSLRQTLIALLSGLLFALFYLKHGLTYMMILSDVFTIFLITLSLIDIDIMILPTKIIYSGTAAALVIKLYQCCKTETYSPLSRSFIAALVTGLLWLFIYWLAIKIYKKECMGVGDIRLFAMIAFFIPNDAFLFHSIYITCFASFAYVILVYILKRKVGAFPFGPFISIGAIISLFIQ